MVSCVIVFGTLSFRVWSQFPSTRSYTTTHESRAPPLQYMAEGWCIGPTTSAILVTGVNPAGDAGDTSPQYFGGGTSTGISPPILLRTFGYSRPILVALRSLSLKPFSFGYKTPPIRFSPLPHPTPFGGSSPQPWTRVAPLLMSRGRSCSWCSVWASLFSEATLSASAERLAISTLHRLHVV